MKTDTPAEPDHRRNGPSGHHPRGDALVLAELAGLDESLRERGSAWKELVGRLDALRRELAVTSAQVQRSRSLVERKAPLDGDTDQDTRTAGLTRDDARATRLTGEFESALRETDKRRVALHAEMEDLRSRRQALLRRLSTAIAGAYQSLADAGRAPAVASVRDGVCGGCGSSLPESVVEALSHEDVAVCAGCDRLLRASEGSR